MIVADANLVAYLLIEGIHTPVARRAFDRDSLWIAPLLWRAEFLNILTTSTRAGVINERQGRALWRRAINTIAMEDEPNPPTVLRVALRRRISAYDAQYVVLARTTKRIVVTADKELARRCPEIVVLMDDFAAGAER